jgi:hypothetical protein
VSLASNCYQRDLGFEGGRVVLHDRLSLLFVLSSETNPVTFKLGHLSNFSKGATTPS